MFATIMTAAGFVSDTEASQSQDTALDDLNVSTTSTAIGAMDVYILNAPGEPTGWSSYSVEAFDACQAIIAASAQVGNGNLPYSINDTFDIDMGGWYDVDPNYGQITQYMGQTNGVTGTWQVFAYTENPNGTWTWKSISYIGVQLGFLRPFEDYATEDYRTANIALAFSLNKIMVSVAPTQGLTQITATDAFAVNFAVLGENGPLALELEGIGYGSDVYAALKELFSRTILGGTPYGVVGNDLAGPYYSWIDTIYGVANAEWPEYFPYWAFYVYEDDQYANFVSGFYSPLQTGYYDQFASTTTGNCQDAWFLLTWE